ncbi:hypothetical protein ACSBR1_021765 [Camellia fascicularis]
MGAEKPVVIFGKSGCCICLTVKALIYVNENRHCSAIVLTSQASFFGGETMALRLSHNGHNVFGRILKS